MDGDATLQGGVRMTDERAWLVVDRLPSQQASSLATVPFILVQSQRTVHGEGAIVQVEGSQIHVPIKGVPLCPAVHDTLCRHWKHAHVAQRWSLLIQPCKMAWTTSAC